MKTKIVIFLFLCYACTNPPSRLRSALEQSGSNQKELEKVLQYFSDSPQDSLKLKAAVFLIENMPGHYTLESTFIDRFRESLPELYPQKPYHWHKAMQTIPERIELNNFWHTTYDLEWLESDYLIHHIENSFRIWQTTPWLRELPFQDFCEYILPYRISNEPPDHFSDSVLHQISRLQTIARHLPLTLSPEHITEILDKIYPDYLKFSFETIFLSEDQNYNPGCLDHALFRMYALKLAGIPVALDYVPYWGDRNGQHYWTSVIYPIYCNNTQTIPLERVPKIYRKTYSHQPFPDTNTDEYIPESFRSPFLKDVTHYYVNTSNLEIKLMPRQLSSRYAYLCVFNAREWHPVCWSERQNNTTCFKNIGRDIVYLPACYKNNQLNGAQYPFILHANGNPEYLIPDTLTLQKMHLTRKNPIDKHKIAWSNLQGGYFEASNDPEFQNSKIIYHTDELYVGKTRIPVDTSMAFRYWRYYLKGYHHMAEIEFYDIHGKGIEGQLICPKDVPNRILNIKNIFDGNPLTYGVIYPYIGIDFGKPISISEIQYTPRNDDNGIVPGNTYELKYHNGEKWISAGMKTADNFYIDFEGVPSRALYWLQNHTDGKEERVFIYNEDKQIFW